MKKQWIVALCAVAALGLTASLIVGSASQVAQVSVATAQFGDFSVAVDVQGEVRASDEYAVMPGVSGRVKEVYVREGQQVKKGQKLFALDDQEAISLLQQARYELQLATNVKQAETEALKAQADIQAREQEARAEAQEAAAQAQMQGLRQAAEEALSMAQNMGIDYHSLNRALSGQLSANAMASEPTEPQEEPQATPLPAPAAADPRVQLARERVKQAEYAVAQHTMSSDADGKVLRMSIHEGELVSAGSQVIVIGETQKPIVVAQIGERDLARIAIGQRAHMTVDGKTYSGHVVRTSPAAMRTAMSAQATGEVEIQPDAGFSAMVGASVEMSVVVAQSSNTCRVPQECVAQENGESYVFVVRDGVARRRNVKLGLHDDFNVEIVQGVAMGERIVITPLNITDAQKVRIVE